MLQETTIPKVPSDKERQLLVCRGTGCESQKAKLLYNTLVDAVYEAGLADRYEVKFTGCHGLCQMGPTVMITPEGTFYCTVTPDDVPEIIETDLKRGGKVERLLFFDPKSKTHVFSYKDMKFFGPQRRIVLRNCGFINPEVIDDYIAVGGYEAIRKVFGMSRMDVINEVKKSGLRGRGGG
ncbi:MAG TPA: NAD(P)H-dependent oxidoreductase subunit E, partial [Syntrophobacteraceae bacterium]|nr:NAD(P)H-dependent oxidoreductase subunit E [Syntrophobacteraceae bacterium]